MNLDLMAASVKPATARQYKTGLDKFIRFIHLSHTPINTPREMDCAMTAFIAKEYSEGGAKSTCVNALSAIAMVTHDFSFRLALRSLRGWGRVQPAVQRPPMPKEVMVVMVETFIMKADIHMAALVLLGFYGFLRISEPLAMKWEDVSPPSRLAMSGEGGAIRLPKSKTGSNQSIRMSSRLFWRLMRQLRDQAGTIAPLTGDERIFNMSYPKVADKLKATLVEIGVGHFKLTCHSMRHGGATSHFLETGDIGYIQAQGSWASMRSLRNYVQSGKSLLLALAIPREVKERARRFLDKVNLGTNNL